MSKPKKRLFQSSDGNVVVIGYIRMKSAACSPEHLNILMTADYVLGKSVPIRLECVILLCQVRIVLNGCERWLIGVHVT